MKMMLCSVKQTSGYQCRLKIDNTNVRFIDVCRQVMDQSTESKEFDYFMMAPSGFKNRIKMEKLINTLFIYEVKNVRMFRRKICKK